jgi:hypothetical protein
MLSGTAAGDHEITVRDVSGRTVDRFRGTAGEVGYRLSPEARGVLFVAIRYANGTELVRLHRI